VHERRSAPWVRELTAGAPELHGIRYEPVAAIMKRAGLVEFR
jgi:hypothetical protein